MNKSYLSYLIEIIRNKFYAELFRSNYFRKLQEKNLKKAFSLKYRASHKESLNWENPQTLDAKIMWLEALSDTSVWSDLADKYKVRDYITQKGYEEILPKCYGVWDRVEDIDFNILPKKFVIKCTHDCGSAIIIKDKAAENWENIANYLKTKLIPIGGGIVVEPHYKKIKPRIIVEELLEDQATQGLSSSLVDYKVWCFNGKPYIVLLCYDRKKKENGHSSVTVDLYTKDTWQHRRDLLTDKSAKYKDIPRPKCLEKMLDIAKDLSDGFPQVRVDFYIINNKPYFGELTFTSAAASHYYFTEEAQREFAKAIDLTNVKLK